MKMQSLTVILGTIAAFALGACTVNTTTSGTGGTSSTGATSTSGEGGVGTSAASTTGSNGTGGDATTSTGTAMCDATYTCSKAIAQGSGDPALLCEGKALMNFDALSACTCSGNCATSCADNACMQLEPSAACKACLVTADTGCKKEFDACVGS